jgi:hypothetical protein
MIARNTCSPSREIAAHHQRNAQKEVQAAAHCVTEAAENDGPMKFAPMGMMQAINRHKPQQFEPKVRQH